MSFRMLPVSMHELKIALIKRGYNHEQAGEHSWGQKRLVQVVQ